jgi:hypothetical protein
VPHPYALVGLAHGRAVYAIRAHDRRSLKTGPAENLVCIPAIETPADMLAIATKPGTTGDRARSRIQREPAAKLQSASKNR